MSYGATTQHGASQGAEVGTSGRVPTSAIYWSNRQRRGHSLHEVPYRACFKPELPRYFIERYSAPGDLVYDPFMGRGTTVLEAWLAGRRPAGNDANPLCRLLIEPRIDPPEIPAIQLRLAALDLSGPDEHAEDLTVFYHPRTLGELTRLRAYFLERTLTRRLDRIDRWLRMVALTRLTGHSPGYFSVYTLPPNQAVSVEAQRRINLRLGQAPEPRDIKAILLKKTRSLLRTPIPESHWRAGADEPPLLLSNDAACTPDLASESVMLIVTSPPFLDVVDYPADNWLRSWFAGFHDEKVPWLMPKKLEDWESRLERCFREFDRVLMRGGHAAIEVGEVNRGRTALEQSIVRLGGGVGWLLLDVLIQSTQFTKTAHCWGVTNNERGTNSNRVVLFRKP